MERYNPDDICGLIAHETAALLYGAGADGIPSTESMRTGLETFAAAIGAADISAHLAWIDSEMVSAREFERTGQDTAHLLDPDRLNVMPEAAAQMEAVWELFGVAVRMPSQQERQAMKDLAVTLADTGGLSGTLLDARIPAGPYLTVSALRTELEEVRTALQTEQNHGPAVEMLP